MTVSEIKNKYRLRDAIRAHGIEIDRNGNCHCPFHNGDHTASLKVYDKQDTFYCFGCGAHGDLITFTMLIDNLSFSDACKAISGEEITRQGKWSIEQEKRRRKAAERKKQALKKEYLDTCEKVCMYWQFLMFDEPASEEWAHDYNTWQKLYHKSDELEKQLYD